MVKLTNSKQVKSKKTRGISQQVESDATSSYLDKTISLKIIPAVTQGIDHVADQDADNDEDQGQAMGDVQKFIEVGRGCKNPHKPIGLL